MAPGIKLIPFGSWIHQMYLMHYLYFFLFFIKCLSKVICKRIFFICKILQVLSQDLILLMSLTEAAQLRHIEKEPSQGWVTSSLHFTLPPTLIFSKKLFPSTSILYKNGIIFNFKFELVKFVPLNLFSREIKIKL